MQRIEIQYLYEAGGRRYYRSFYENTEIIWSQHANDPSDLLISAESFAHMQGFASFEEMMADDRMLDKINEFMRETGAPFPFQDSP